MIFVFVLQWIDIRMKHMLDWKFWIEQLEYDHFYSKNHNRIIEVYLSGNKIFSLDNLFIQTNKFLVFCPNHFNLFLRIQFTSTCKYSIIPELHVYDIKHISYRRVSYIFIYHIIIKVKGKSTYAYEANIYTYCNFLTIIHSYKGIDCYNKNLIQSVGSDRFLRRGSSDQRNAKQCQIINFIQLSIKKL